MAGNNGTALAGLRLRRITRGNGAARRLNRQSFLRRPRRRQEWRPLHRRAYGNGAPPATSSRRHKAVATRRGQENDSSGAAIFGCPDITQPHATPWTLVQCANGYFLAVG